MTEPISTLDILQLKPKETFNKEEDFANLDTALDHFKYYYEYLGGCRNMLFDDEGRGFDFSLKIRRSKPYTISINIIKDE